MNTLLLRFLILNILGFFIFNSCDDLEVAYNEPGISIYKTNGDYFELTKIGMKGELIYRYDSYSQDFGELTCKLLIIGDDTVYRYRARLQDGYILDAEADERYDAFLSLSYKEYLIKEQYNIDNCLPLDALRKYILDKDPYNVFYRNKTKIKRFTIADSLEIDEIIRGGQIDEYFEKRK
jgi:hypothetical protein